MIASNLCKSLDAFFVLTASTSPRGAIGGNGDGNPSVRKVLS